MREIITHKVAGLNDGLALYATDGPGLGGANHEYVIGPSHEAIPPFEIKISFQTGTINEPDDVNGISNEVLLAIVRDRLEGFQRGDFACPENEQALGFVNYAMNWLQSRTLSRVKRGVEGKLEA